jgi:hypothetical protein
MNEAIDIINIQQVLTDVSQAAAVVGERQDTGPKGFSSHLITKY